MIALGQGHHLLRSVLAWWRTVRTRVRSRSGFAWLIGITLLLLASAPLAAFILSPGRTWETQILEDFNSGHLVVASALDVRAGFRANQDGWYLPAGTSGELHYRIAKRIGSNLAAQLWLYSQGASMRAELRINSGERSQFLTNPYFVGEVIELAPADAETSVELVLSATNTSSNAVLVLDQLVYGPTRGAAPPRPGTTAILAFGLLLGLAFFPLLEAGRWNTPIAVAIAVLMSVTTSERIDALNARASDTLDPDAIVYRIYADSFRWWPPWESGLFSGNFGEREPLFPMLVNAYFRVLGSSDFHLRVVSSTLSVLGVVLTLVAARRRLAWPAGLAVAGIVALNRPLVDESLRGLRTELELCLVLALYLVLDRPPSLRPRLDAMLGGLVGLALVLTRTFYLPMILVAIVISFFARYRPLTRALTLTSIATLLVVGAATAHRIALYERQGDAFYDTSGYARWNANYEKFQLGRDVSHPELFPSKSEVVANGLYVGPRITYAQYLFQIHSFPEFVAGTATGFADVYANTGGAYVPGLRDLAALSPQVALIAKSLTDLLDQGVKFIGVVGLLGLLASAVLRRELRDLLIPAMIVSGLAFTTFLYHLQLVERYRNTMQFYPLLIIAGIWFLQDRVLPAMRSSPRPIQHDPVQKRRRSRTSGKRR